MISVLVPVYNSAKYLKACLKSILKQSFKDFELVIVNDGSTDKSEEIILELMKKDNRIVYYKKENEKSISKTRNYLLKKIKGECFIFIDSDDIVEKDFLKILYDTMNKTDSDIVSCDFKILRTPSLIKRGYGVKQVNSLTALDMMLFSGKFYALWNKLMKKKVIKGLHFDESVNYGEDLLFFFNILKKDYKFTFINNPLYYYRLHKNSLSSGSLNDAKKDFLKRLIEISKEDKYQSIKEIINCWIYVSAQFYRYKTFKDQLNEDEYLNYLEEVIKEHQKDYARFRKDHLIFDLITKFFASVDALSS